MRLNTQRTVLRLCGTAMLLVVCIPQAYAASFWSFNTNDTAGAPGTTVGWDYTISNLDSMDWLSLTGLNVDPFLHGTPQLLFDFPIIAPSATLTVPYDGTNGLYELTWDGTAPMGFVNTGKFTLSADWYNGDPLTSGSFIAAAGDQSVTYRATVVPVPAAWVLFASGLAGLTAFRRRKHKIQN
jgi:hypothetical protein